MSVLTFDIWRPFFMFECVNSRDRVVASRASVREDGRPTGCPQQACVNACRCYAHIGSRSLREKTLPYWYCSLVYAQPGATVAAATWLEG